MDFGHLFVAASLAVLIVSLAARRNVAKSRAPETLYSPEELRDALARGALDEIELRLQARLAGPGQGTLLDRLQLAQVLVLRGAYRRAEEIMAVEGSSVWGALALVVMGEIVALEGDPSRAESEILTLRQQALGSFPERVRPRMLSVWDGVRGLALARGQEDEAASALLIAALRDALRNAPTRAIYVFHLARCLDRSGRQDAARVRYQEVADSAPGTVWADVARLHLDGHSP